MKVLVGTNGTEVIGSGQSGGNTAEGTFHLAAAPLRLTATRAPARATRATRAPVDLVTAAGGRPARASAKARLAVRPPGIPGAGPLCGVPGCSSRPRWCGIS